MNPDPTDIRLPSVPMIASMTIRSAGQVLLTLLSESSKHGNKCAYQTGASDSSDRKLDGGDGNGDGKHFADKAKATAQEQRLPALCSSEGAHYPFNAMSDMCTDDMILPSCADEVCSWTSTRKM